MKFICKDPDTAFFLPSYYAFETNKYMLELIWFYDRLNETFVKCKKIPFGIHQVKIVNKKDKQQQTIPAKFIFNILPDLDDMIDYAHVLSDRKINEKIEKVLTQFSKLKAFL